VTFEADLTALLVVDSYNNFISEGGKLWPNVKEIAEAVNCVSNMRDVLRAARNAGLRVIFVPHHRWRENDIAGRKYLAPIQRRGYERRIFEAGSWGGEFHPDFRPSAGELIAQEHWCSSGFANTDLDLLLKQQGIHKLIVIGLRANTCIDSTVRFAAKLDYEVTLVKDALASDCWEEMKATLEWNAPNYATAILSAAEVISVLLINNSEEKTFQAKIDR
jgi:ureidoacrylate peracid hydrolase